MSAQLGTLCKWKFDAVSLFNTE